jgi:S-adenosylmethionine:tRNA ribosyltransferase-isomerase
VIPGRLLGRKATGGKVEVLLLDYAGERKIPVPSGTFLCNGLVKASKGVKPGTLLYFDQDLVGEIITASDGICRIRFSFEGEFEQLLYRVGQIPLPPYIRRPRNEDALRGKAASRADQAAYQTVYASEKGAIAAPTAGLHFTEELLTEIGAKGVKIVAITLHVGYGTFAPVRVSDIREHKIHSEVYSIPKETADTINSSKKEGHRIVAVGTTCVRTLEYAAETDGRILPGNGRCDLFIYPGYRFEMVDAMITNFHLPKSTLLMLLSAFAGRTKVLEAYREAIHRKYRFYSYGDAMFVGPLNPK